MYNFRSYWNKHLKKVFWQIRSDYLRTFNSAIITTRLCELPLWWLIISRNSYPLAFVILKTISWRKNTKIQRCIFHIDSVFWVSNDALQQTNLVTQLLLELVKDLAVRHFCLFSVILTKDLLFIQDYKKNKLSELWLAASRFMLEQTQCFPLLNLCTYD